MKIVNLHIINITDSFNFTGSILYFISLRQHNFWIPFSRGRWTSVFQDGGYTVLSQSCVKVMKTNN